MQRHRTAALDAINTRIQEATAIQLGYDGKRVLNQERIVCIAQYVDAESHER